MVLDILAVYSNPMLHTSTSINQSYAYITHSLTHSLTQLLYQLSAHSLQECCAINTLIPFQWIPFTLNIYLQADPPKQSTRIQVGVYLMLFTDRRMLNRPIHLNRDKPF